MKKLDIIYEDKHIIVVNKKSGVLTIATNKREINTLYEEVKTYEKKKYPKNKIFIVHRLDKDTSGVIVFAKSEEVKFKLQNNWDNVCKARKYQAIVCGKPKKEQDTLVDYLLETKTYQTYISKDNSGKKAITKYNIIRSNRQYSFLDIEILTGRRNQIRAQLANIGCPIIGDKKFDAKSNPLRRLGLHASELDLVHPVTNQILELKAKTPSNFEKVI